MSAPLTNSDVQTFLAKHRAEVRADVAATEVDCHLTKTPHGFSPHGRLVINCPNCGERMLLGTPDSDFYTSDEAENECGHCGAAVAATMRWEAVPELVALEVKAWRLTEQEA